MTIEPQAEIQSVWRTQQESKFKSVQGT
jgi:hypothetical protein